MSEPQLLFFQRLTSWRQVADAARTTIRREAGDKEPSSKWKRRILLAEHSPIRQLLFRWKWTNLKYWVSVHIVRHKVGIEHFVSTQRTDRTGVNRDEIPQAAVVDHECIVNAQTLITISRKRLCAQASPETRQAWRLVVEALRQTDPEVAACCVPECVYRGFCPEFKSCGYAQSEPFKQAVAAYRKVE